MKIGFIGIGAMGMPMARNLLHAGVPLVVWNRTPSKCASLVGLGAAQVDSVDELCRQATVVLLMLLDDAAIDESLGRGTPSFRSRVTGRTFVQLGTTSPAYSVALEKDILECDGSYVEAPVSGSRVPAEQGQLVGMVAGHPDIVASILPLLKPMCSQVFPCGSVPDALRMKLAVNHYLIAMVTALAETVHAARLAGLDIALLRDILDAGPMASDVSRIKLGKLVAEDFSAQAAIRDVRNITKLVAEQSMRVQAHVPLIEECLRLYRSADEAGYQELDMTAVIKVFAGTPDARHKASVSREPTLAFMASEAPSRTKRSSYPEPFASHMRGRDKKALGDLFGLRNFGVNLTRLAPRAVSSLKHAHSRQDEFVYVLQGHPVLRTEGKVTPLEAGMCVGFPCGTGLWHQLANESSISDAVYLEIGDRTKGDTVTYVEDDLVAFAGIEGWYFFHRDGTPY